MDYAMTKNALAPSTSPNQLAIGPTVARIGGCNERLGMVLLSLKQMRGELAGPFPEPEAAHGPRGIPHDGLLGVLTAETITTTQLADQLTDEISQLRTLLGLNG